MSMVMEELAHYTLVKLRYSISKCQVYPSKGSSLVPEPESSANGPKNEFRFVVTGVFGTVAYFLRWNNCSFDFGFIFLLVPIIICNVVLQAVIPDVVMFMLHIVISNADTSVLARCGSFAYDDVILRIFFGFDGRAESRK